MSLEPQAHTIESNEISKAKIDILATWELLGTPQDSAHAQIFLDRGKEHIYRKMDLTRDYRDPDRQIADFWGKVRVGMYDKSGLTPHIYSYDPDKFILEMEWISGARLDTLTRNSLSISQIQEFYKKLGSFHSCGLSHMDLYSLKNYLLDAKGHIRLVDPTYVEANGSTWLNLLGQQLQDREQAIRTLSRNFGFSRENITGQFLDYEKQVQQGTFINDVGLYGEILDYKGLGIGHVFQRGIGLSDDSYRDKSPRYLETSNIGSCVVVCLYARDSGKSALIHADQLMNINESIKVASEYLHSTQVETSIVGGTTGKSEHLLHELNDILATQKGWRMINQDTLGSSGNLKQVILDCWTGDVYVLYSDSQVNLFSHHPWQPTQEMITRQNLLNIPENEYYLD